MRRPPEDGFALILALLALVLLTFLGLTLAATTSTELQISTNYRWSRQAYYSAEAGLEAGRAALRDMSWGTVLPAARAVAWFPSAGGLAPTPPFNVATRNLERGGCDTQGAGVGYGVVLDDGNGPWEQVEEVAGHELAGATTIWIRRRLVVEEDGSVHDDADSDVLVLTAEGVAPYTGRTGMRQSARHVLEARLRRRPTALGWDVLVESSSQGTTVCP
jgi:Tfp pilus assembly protein PilX